MEEKRTKKHFVVEFKIKKKSNGSREFMQCLKTVIIVKYVQIYRVTTLYFVLVRNKCAL